MREEETQGTPLSRRRRMAVVTVMLAIPLSYAALARGGPTAPVSMASADSAAGAGVTVAQMEQAAQSRATVANQIALSMAYINGGAPGKAVPMLKTILAEDGKNATAWNNLCVANMGLQQFRDAIEACEAGVRVDPGMQLLKNNLKWANDEAAKARAVVVSEAGKPRERRDSNSYMLEGLNRMHLGEYSEAQQAWYQCVAMNPKDALAENDIGVAFMMLGRSSEAAAAFTKALNVDPANGLYKNNLAWAQTTK